MDEDKRKLIADFSSYFENSYNLPPLTSKIYAYLLMDCKREGTTFDEMVEIFHASKSSVSNSLNFLSQLKYIEIFSKIDSRKRFYRASSETVIMRLEKIHDMLKEEKKLSLKFRKFMEKEIQDTDNISLIKSDIYINHLELSIQQLAETLKKLKTVKENH